MKQPRLIALAYLFSFLLLFVWSLPGTIALRTLLMIGALALATGSLVTTNAMAPTARAAPRAPLVALALLSAWLLIGSLFISHDSRWSLGELRGQWLTGLIALTLGLLLGNLDNTRPIRDTSRLWTGIALVLGSQCLIAVGQSFWHWIGYGEMLRNEVPLTGGKLEMSYIVNILLAILTVDLFFRATERRPLLHVPLAINLSLVAAGLTSNYLAGSRNGVIGTVFLAASTAILFFIDGRHRIGRKKAVAAVVALMALMAVFSVASYRADPRWKIFAETAEIAMDLDGNKAWLDADNTPPPLLGDGTPVDMSAYLRIAWLTAGGRLIFDQPYGVGYGRNAFVRALKRQGYAAKLGHAHSGFVDLLAGGGVPAVLLWLAFAATLIVAGWRSFAMHRNPQGLLLILLASGFNGRMLIESVNRDHMLQMFFFLVGALLIGSTLSKTPQGRRGAAPTTGETRGVERADSDERTGRSALQFVEGR